MVTRRLLCSRDIRICIRPNRVRDIRPSTEGKWVSTPNVCDGFIARLVLVREVVSWFYCSAVRFHPNIADRILMDTILYLVPVVMMFCMLYLSSSRRLLHDHGIDIFLGFFVNALNVLSFNAYVSASQTKHHGLIRYIKVLDRRHVKCVRLYVCRFSSLHRGMFSFRSTADVSHDHATGCFGLACDHLSRPR